MTVRGAGCMEHTQPAHATAACNGHTDQHTDQRSARRSSTRDSRTDTRSSVDSDVQRLSTTSQREDSFTDLDTSDKAACLTKSTEDDDLPLGSEANSLRQGQGHGVVARPPVDKRLLSLRQHAGGGGGGGGCVVGGGGQLLHSGWTSFNSDLSNLTSGSNHSANSLEWLLQGRQVDPEQVLLNLGFGGSTSATPSMYGRIPDRFLQQEEEVVVVPEEDVIPEGAPAEAAPAGRNPSRAMAAWTRARTMSSAMFSLKLLSSLQHGTPLAPLAPGLFQPSLPASSSPSLTPPGRARSVLHPDNQRALARQGFYGDNLPDGVDVPDFMNRGEEGADESDGRKKSAEDRRKQFHKTRSKRHRSLVESGEDEGDSQSRDSLMKSVDFSTTTESTDSGGELSTSAPTTPGDVFLDRTPSPLSGAGGPSFPLDRLTNIEDLYLPDRGSSGSGLSRSRQKLSENLDLDSDDNLLITPCPSRQPTVEKAATLTDSQSEGLDRDLGGGDGDGGGGGGDGGGRRERSSSSGGDGGAKGVTIVVSGDAKRQRVASSPRNKRSLSSNGAGGPGGMNFLSIVSAAMDRMSDSGSEHTLVDHQSSSSGSPRPLTGSESPRLLAPDSPRAGNGAGNVRVPTSCESPVVASQGSAGSRSGSGSGSGGPTRHVESGPVLYVYHSRAEHSVRDENDNLPHALPKQVQNLHPHHGNHQGVDEDLPRMSSIQSDSSGFGDTEMSGDSAAAVSDMASLKVSNLGSSCESSATMASTNTVVGANSSINLNNNNNNLNNSYHHHTDTAATQTPPHLLQGSPEVPKRRSHSADDLLRSDTSQSGRRYVTMCYIPSLNTPYTAQQPLPSIPVTSLISSATRSGRASPRGPTQISVVLREKERGKVYWDRPPADKNEMPLSEELALASDRGVVLSSATRHGSLPGGVLSRYPGVQVSLSQFSRVGAQRVTGDTSSVDGSRGSGDELEREDRSLSYSSWSRELPAASSCKTGRSRARQYPATDEESGASVEAGSVYSCASTSDSIASGSGSELLDCHKLLKLINQPTVFKGRRTRVVNYRPKRHVRDWPALLKKKRLQEETRLAQYAMQKFKTELSIMETSVMVRYHMTYEDMTQDDRDDVEELQHLWAEVRRHVMETEQLLTSRMKSLACGNDSFNFLSSIRVLQRLIDLLKEQHFQRQLDTEEEEQREEEEEWEDMRGGRYRWGSTPRYSSVGSWAELPRPSPRPRGRHSSSTSHLPLSPAFSEPSYDQLRSSLMSEVREEMRSNIQTLQHDLHKRDSEIHRLQVQLMLEGRSKKPRSGQHHTRSPRRRVVKETDV